MTDKEKAYKLAVDQMKKEIEWAGQGSEGLVNIKTISPDVPYMEKVANIEYTPVILGQSKLF